MTLVEAGRQAFLAVTERFFIPEGESGEYYFVTRSKQVSFRNFAFPLPTVMHYEIVNKQLEDRDRLRFNVNILICQAGDAIADLRFSFTAYNKRHLVKKEHEKSTAAINAFFQEIETAGAPRPLVTLKPRSLSSSVSGGSVDGGLSDDR